MDATNVRELLAEHHEAGFAWAVTCCSGNRTEAEDVLHTAYVKILDGRALFGGQSAFRTWLFGVIRYTAVDERRRHWLRALGLTSYTEAQGPETLVPGADTLVEQSETRRAFREAVARLPQRQQQVLHLVFYQDLTIQDAADVLGLSVGSARTHYERGKQRLRGMLQAEFGS